MDLFEAIKGRRSVRKYTGEKVAEEDLKTILEAGRMAPSWTNSQCWEVVIVRDPAAKTALMETLSATNPARDAVQNAPIVMAACGKKRLSGFKKGEQATALGDWLMFDVALFLNNVTLAAYALGYGTVHVGLFDHAKAAGILGVPSEYQVVELIPIGRPAAPLPSGPKRREILEFVHEDRF